uniref:Gse1 coiled-coil protein n=1 Tax=Poecilia formosa TaxID=48698 RepID=A0A087YHQ3_POEFO
HFKASCLSFFPSGMNHESNKSASLGMISTATRTTATVSPLSPLTNGNAAAQSANSGFAAALRKLAKQAEDPRVSALSGESSPVSSPGTSHPSPVATPKRGSLGPFLGQSRGHSVPSNPPVVTIAPTKTSNGQWRADGRQVESSVQGLSRERVGAESAPLQQDKRTPPVPPPHSLAQSFGRTHSSIMQDPRLQSISLPGQMHAVVPSGAVPEEYLRALRPFATSDDLRLTSLPLSLDPAAAAHAAAAAAYYHPAYLHHPLSLQSRMEESLCLSALRSQFYSMPAGGAFPPLHPSALQLHLPGGRYPGEINHTAFSERSSVPFLLVSSELLFQDDIASLQHHPSGGQGGLNGKRALTSVWVSVDALSQMFVRGSAVCDQMVRTAESQYLAELQARRAAPPEDRARPGERLTPTRLGCPDKTKDPDQLNFPGTKAVPLQPGLSSSRASVPLPVPSLLPAHLGKHRAVASGGIHEALAAAMMTQRASEEVWLARQRAQGQEREGPLEVGLRSPGKGAETRRDSHRTSSVYQNPGSKDIPLGAPPPLISPKGPHHSAAPPTSLWNPASLVDTPADSRRKFNAPTPPTRPPPGLTRTDRPPTSWGDDAKSRRTSKSPERCPPLRGAASQEPWSRTEPDRAPYGSYPRHHINNHHRPTAPPSAPTEQGLQYQAGPPSLIRERQTQAVDSMLIYDEVLQQHRRLLSKLDQPVLLLSGYYYDLDESYDESDEEEVKAHLRRVTEQPPLKLDTSSEKVDFLRLCGLTTLTHRDELLGSLSPPAVQSKRKICSLSTPTASLTTQYSAEQMDSTPELEEKKDFLLMFNLSHVSRQQRRDKEKTEELLRAIQRKTVTLDTLRYNPLPLCRSPASLLTGNSSAAPQSNGHQYPESPSPSPPDSHRHRQNDTPKASMDSQVPRIPPPLAPHHDKCETAEAQSNRKLQVLQNGTALQKKEPGPLANGRSRPWERFTPEAFAQRFHQAVLQSTHSTLNSKGVSNCAADVGGKPERSLPPHNRHLKTMHINHGAQHAHVNGHHFHLPAASQDAPALREHLSNEEEEESDDEEEEEAPRKWQGIEAIFEAYQEYVDEWSIERQVLHSQCKRLEAQNYNLTRTAEQLSLTMGELVSQRQKVREERDRLQAQLEHFRRCLTLPNVHWGRSQSSGQAQR